MPALRNGPHGYGVVTRVLHWVTVVLLAVQVVVGYTMGSAADRAADRAEQRLDAFEEAGEERAERAGEAAEERFEREVERREEAIDAAEDGPSPLHVGLGLGLLGLGLGRLAWRRTTPLPPWSDRLSPRDRRLQGLLEKALLALLIVVPATGLLLLVADDAVAVHVAAHVALYVVVLAHVALVLRRGTLPRMVGGRDRPRSGESR
ncbi:cytochrome b/b6 domain-containing protein [Nocardioides sp. SOB77]|uniref:Cytochrome b/b6 domain-containing protein n=1 Tax=Nocardioides oceani TaxID=3058369 RepID=A0ABT8FD52_9ACTN|nr:cytochrome b/b6 domain-containing protein [Nocardioides oceani]MDN4172613.1 cytochrome b/b6 domain-containing protein [Nocardioides oceani]